MGSSEGWRLNLGHAGHCEQKGQVLKYCKLQNSMGSAKIKRTNIMRIINANAVWGRLSENYLT